MSNNLSVSRVGRGTGRIHSSGFIVLDLLVHNSSLTAHVGGTAANVAINLAVLGWKSGVSALLGNDRAGSIILRQFQEYGVDTTGVILRDDVKTPVVIHEVLGNRHRFKFSCPVCGSKYPKFRPLPVSALPDIHDADVYFFDRASAYAMHAAMQVREQGSVVVFEPGTPGRAEATSQMTDLAHLFRVSGALADPAVTAATQVIGMAENGVKFRTNDSDWVRSPSKLSAPPVDAGGAGDWLTAGIIHRLGAAGILHADREELSDAVEFGQRLAGISCRYVGTRGMVLVDGGDPDLALLGVGGASYDLGASEALNLSCDFWHFDRPAEDG